MKPASTTKENAVPAVKPVAEEENDGFVGSHEAARIFGCTVNSVKRWSREGRLPIAATTAAGARRYNPAVLRGIAVRYRNGKESKAKGAALTTAILHAAIFDRFKQRSSLEDIVCELAVPAPVVLELYELYSQGVPYDGPKLSPREKAKTAREAEETAVRAHDRAMLAFDKERLERQEREEREHQRSLERLRKG